MVSFSKTRLCLLLIGISFVLFLLIISCGNDGSHSSVESNIVDLRKRINGYLERTGVPSLAIAVAKDGEILWEEGFGWANVEMKTKSTPHTRYPLASITKNLTATALMSLVERGDVDVDRSVNDYLGDIGVRAFQGKVKDATVKRILQHTAGLPLYYDAYYEDQMEDRMSLEETIRRYGILVSAPGERYQYSSLGYGIIEYIIEQISHKSYAEFMKQDVFEPLGMSEATLFDSLPADAAIEYRSDNTPAQFAKGAVRAGGGIYCSAHDLVRYGMFHLKNHLDDQKPILSDSIIDLMQNEFDSSADNAQYALGWRIEKVADYNVFSHNGGGLGSDTRFAIIPSENLAVVVLANSRSGNSTYVSDEIIRTILTDFERESWWDRFCNKFKGSDAETIDYEKELAGSWVGTITTYKRKVPLSLVIKTDGSAKLMTTDDSAGNGEWMVAKRAISTRECLIELMFEAEILKLNARRTERYLLLQLSYDGTTLYGTANAGNSTELIYCVPSYIELARVGSSE